MTGNDRYKIAATLMFPIHYATRLLRRMSEHPKLDVTVYLYSAYGLDGPYIDQEFGGRSINWGIDL